MLPEVPGILTGKEVAATADHIASWQLRSGMIPWFPGGHADPWNHVEAAMALSVGGRRSEAEQVARRGPSSITSGYTSSGSRSSARGMPSCSLPTET